MEGQCRAISMWRWLPFEMPDGEVQRYLISNEGFNEAVGRLFDSSFGGFDPNDEKHVNLIRSIKARAWDCGDYVSIDDEIAGLFSKAGATCDEADIPDCAPGPMRGISGQELDVLDMLCTEGELYPESIGETTSLGEGAVRDCLSKLSRSGLVVAKADGRHVLTQEGVLAWAELKFEGGPVGDMDAMLEITQRWQGALRRIHGFEKNLFFLSNFYPAPVELEGLRYPSSEAAYQAGRCASAAEKEKFACLSAAEAKKFGHHGITTREDWDDFKVGHMRRVVGAKFEQHGDLAEELVGTHGILEESNWWGDAFWGCCLQDDGRCRGRNMLGEILMEERARWLEWKQPYGSERPSKEHRFSLEEEPWSAIESGVKDVELRLYDEKRKDVLPGDTIVFSRKDGTPGSMRARVEFVDVYPGFEELLRDVDPSRCGFTLGEPVDASRMEHYYGPEQLEQHCAVAIGIRLVKSRQDFISDDKE